MENIKEIQGMEGLYRIDKIKLTEIIPLEKGFIIKDSKMIDVVEGKTIESI